jgi:hypothetical protein
LASANTARCATCCGGLHAEHSLDRRRRGRQRPAREQCQRQRAGNGDDAVERRVAIGEGQQDHACREGAEQIGGAETIGMHQHEHREGEGPERALHDDTQDRRIVGARQKADPRHAETQRREQQQLDEQEAADHGRLGMRRACQPDQRPEHRARRPDPGEPWPGAVAQHHQRAGAYRCQVKEQWQGMRRLALHQRRHGEGPDEPECGDKGPVPQRQRDSRGGRQRQEREGQKGRQQPIKLVRGV